MKTWYHRKIKNSWQWIGFDFTFRLLPFILLILLSYIFLPDIRGNFYLVDMNFYSWVLTIILCTVIILCGIISQKNQDRDFIQKLHHHHYKHLIKSKEKKPSIVLYKILFSAPITSMFCFVFFPAILRSYLPFHTVFLLFPAAFLFPFEYILLEGHSGRNFFWQTLLSLWLIMLTYVIQSALFPIIICVCLAFSQVHLSKVITKEKAIVLEKAR